MLQTYDKMPPIPVGTPCVRGGNMPDTEVMRYYKKIEASRHAHNARMLGKRPGLYFNALPQPAFMDLVSTLTVAGSNFGTFTTAKTVLPTNSLGPIPAGYFTIGRILDIEAWGLLSNLVTTPGTVTFQVMLGSVVVFTSGAIQMNATAHTTNPFWFRALLTCRAVGSGTSANFMGQSWVMGKQFTNTATTVDADRGVNVGFSAGAETTDAAIMAPETTPTVGTGFDSTIAQTLDFWVGFSISNAANNVTVQGYKALSIA